MELMSVSCPGSIDVGSATSPTTSVLPAAIAPRSPAPASASASTVPTASTVRRALIASSPLCALRPGSESAQSRVERVAQPVAYEVTAQDQDEDGQPGNGGHVRRHRDELTAVREHRPPVRGRRLSTEPDEAEPRAFRDHDSDVHRHEHEDGPDDAGEHVAAEDASFARAHRSSRLHEVLLTQQEHRSSNAARVE